MTPGSQLDNFAASLFARYRGEEPPDDGYHGEYLVEMADRMRSQLGDAATEEQARDWGYRWAVEGVRHDLDRIGVQFDTWFSESTLHESGAVAEVLDDLRNRGFVYEQDGATWLRSTDFGDQRDRVLVKSDGDSTYLLADLAYHRNKFERGWEHLIDIWGADHHGQVKSIQAGMEALGYPAGEPEVLLGQLVKLERGGEVVRLSRTGGEHHHPGRHPRRGRPRRRSPHLPLAEHRHHTDDRPRPRHRPVDGQSRLLRAIRARCALRRSDAAPRSAGSRGSRSST